MTKNEKWEAESKKRFLKTARFAFRITKLVNTGKYKLAVLLMSRHVEGMTVSMAYQKLRYDRVYFGHRIYIGGCGKNGVASHWAHCECGWSGKEVPETETSYKELSKTICPVFIAKCERYGYDVETVLSAYKD